MVDTNKIDSVNDNTINGRKRKLTEKQKRFSDLYIISLNATQAYKDAGFTSSNDNVAAASACKLLKVPKVEAYIKSLMEARNERTTITADKVLRRLSRIALSKITDVCDFTNEGVKIKNSEELDDDALASIESVTVIETTTTTGDVNVRKTIKLKKNDKALELLAKHTGVTNELNSALATLKMYGYHAIIDPDTGDVVELKNINSVESD